MKDRRRDRGDGKRRKKTSNYRMILREEGDTGNLKRKH
jgi:hypothetical protein